VVQAARVVAVAMCEYDEIEPREIDTERVCVEGEIVEVATGIEENALAAVFDERRVAQPRLSAEGLRTRRRRWSRARMAPGRSRHPLTPE